MRLHLLIICILTVFSTGIIGQNQPNNPTSTPTKQDKKIQELNMEYGEIKQKLQNIQNQALQNEKLLNESLDITKKIDKTIIANHPKVKEKVQKRASIREEYEEKVKEGDPNVLQKLQGEFQQISQDLVPYDKEAAQDEKIMKMRSRFQAKMIEEMVNIEPKTKKYLKRMREIETIAAKMQDENS